MAFVFTAFPVNGYPIGAFPILSFPGYAPEEGVPARERGGKWFRSKKELALLEAQIQREDEELIAMLTILIEKELN